MVPGLDRFREHFKGHEDSYTLIGGAAYSLIFEEVGIDFRATGDFDMVPCVEVVDASFAEVLKSFLSEGGYQACGRAEGQREFYRFHKPTDGSYPDMLELFSTKANIFGLVDGNELATVPVVDNVLSLSAILLEFDYYEALIASRREINGVHVLDETLLIPLKAQAFVDLSTKREVGSCCHRPRSHPFGLGQRKCGLRVSASGRKIAEEIGQVPDTLFFHQVHDEDHRLEIGAANMLSAKGTT